MKLDQAAHYLKLKALAKELDDAIAMCDMAHMQVCEQLDHLQKLIEPLEEQLNDINTTCRELDEELESIQADMKALGQTTNDL